MNEWVAEHRTNEEKRKSHVETKLYEKDRAHFTLNWKGAMKRLWKLLFTHVGPKKDYDTLIVEFCFTRRRVSCFKW